MGQGSVHRPSLKDQPKNRTLKGCYKIVTKQKNPRKSTFPGNSYKAENTEFTPQAAISQQPSTALTHQLTDSPIRN